MSNNQKMREALDEIKNTANSALTALSTGNCPSSLLWDIIRKCETALATLAAPPEPTGNVAKMRKALEIISRTELPPNSHTTEEGEVITYADGNKWLGRMRTAVALTKDALTAPPRNCDRFDSLLEAYIGYSNECPVDQDNIRTMTFNEWLFAEKKGVHDEIKR